MTTSSTSHSATHSARTRSWLWLVPNCRVLAPRDRPPQALRQLRDKAERKLVRDQPSDEPGGPPTTIADAPTGRGGAYSPGGMIVFSPGLAAPLLRISAAGGSTSPASAFASGETSHRFPTFLPDGRRFLFSTPDTLVVGTLGTLSHRLVRGFNATSPVGQHVEVRDKFLLFARDRSLMAQTFDSGPVEMTGEPRLIADSTASIENMFGAFSSSMTDTLVYNREVSHAELVWYDRSRRPCRRAAVNRCRQWLGRVVARWHTWRLPHRRFRRTSMSA